MQLRDYIDANRSRKFKLGVHDCFTFTNEWWRCKTGSGYGDHLIGKYGGTSPRGYRDLFMREHSVEDWPSVLDILLMRVRGFPPRGSIVIAQPRPRFMNGFVTGIANGSVAIFAGRRGAYFVDIEQIWGAWA